MPPLVSNHDLLAASVAQQIIRDIRSGSADWSGVFDPTVALLGGSGWPRPDNVIVETTSGLAAAVEFKPPDQTKREYLTGLGQAYAYTRDYHHGLLVLPQTADDGYPIGEHIREVLEQQSPSAMPVGLIQYDPARLSAASAEIQLLRKLEPRASGPARTVSTRSSFYAKWRDASPDELGRFLEYLYEEGRVEDVENSVRDRAFGRLWADIIAGDVVNLAGEARKVKADKATAWGKNYRNFVNHVGWTHTNGRLTDTGLNALRLVHGYGADSRVFLDEIGRAVLNDGKHLVLINAISDIQDGSVVPAVESDWLDMVEAGLGEKGLLKRNPGRHAAAVQGSARAFLKAEKTLWRNLEFVKLRGQRVFHPGRGFVFDWGRITSLLG